MLKHVNRPTRSFKKRSNTANELVGTTHNDTKNTPSNELEVTSSRKQRRHTTGSTKETVEDIKQAKELLDVNGVVVNEIGQEIDPNSTLGRKQLISMLKQRYGSEMENFRTTGELSEKERIRRERQRERDLRHDQKLHQENRELIHRGGVHHSPHINGSRVESYTGSICRSSSGSRGSGGSVASDNSELNDPNSPGVRRTIVTKSSTVYNIKNNQMAKPHQFENERDRLDSHGSHASYDSGDSKPVSKGVVFLQYRDEVKRITMSTPISSLDTIKAMFVNAFTGKVSIPHFEEGWKNVYIKDTDTGVYYQLEDVNEVMNRSFLKIHEPESPSQSTSTLDYHNKFAEADAYNQNRTRGGDREYAESLQDFVLSPGRLKKHGSANSLRSDCILTRPTHMQNNTSFSYIQDDQTRVQPVSESPPKQHNPPFSPVLKRKPESTSSKAVTVEDQLADLTDLLKTALDDEEIHHEAVLEESIDIKNPGKIDQHRLEDLQSTFQSMARKKSFPKYYQPTVIVKAQQETDRVTPIEDQSFKNTPPTSKRATTTVKISSLSKSTVAKSDNDSIEDNVFSPPPKAHQENKETVSSNSVTNDSHLTNRLEMVNGTKKQYDTSNDKKEIDEVDYSVAIADDLLNQLLELEEEVNARKSSRLPSVENSRRSSNSSLHNKTNILPLASTPKTKIIPQTSAAKMPPPYTIDNIDTQEDKRKRQTSFSGPPTSTAQPILQRSRTLSSKPSSIATHQYSTPTQEYATISELSSSFESPTSSKITTTFGVVTETVNADYDSKIKAKPSRKMCERPSVTTPDFLELEESAQTVKTKLTGLKKELGNLRKFQIDNAKYFKADLQKKLLEFRKKATKVDDILQQKLDLNNNFIFANEHPVRERRHRLTADQIDYQRKMSQTEKQLSSLESDMEMLRIDVVNKKRVDDPEELAKMHDDLTDLTKRLTDIRNKYHGLHDMLKVVMKSEMEVIKTEENFLASEPENIDSLIGRCKTLSSTLFTLQKLAKVQTNALSGQPNKQRMPSQANNNRIGSQSDYNRNVAQSQTAYKSNIFANYGLYTQPAVYQQLDGIDETEHSGDMQRHFIPGKKR